MKAVINTILKTIISIVLLFMVSVLLTACEKSVNKKECPLQSYNIICDEKYWDLEFGGYNTGTHQYTIQSNCPEDAQKAASDMSYTMGQIYKHCRVVP